MALPSTTSEPTSSAESLEKDAAQLNEEEQQTEAVVNDEDTSQTSETAETEPEAQAEDNSEDTELKEWAAKKNLPLDDPIKLAKMYRESEQALGKKGSKEGQLKTAVTDANASAGVDDVQSLRNELTALSFKIDHPESVKFEPAMIEILDEKPWLANDLESVLDIAKGRATNTQLVAERQAGKKEGLAAAETAGRAAPPRASANQGSTQGSNKITFENVDELIAKNGPKWFADHHDEINAVLAG